MIDWIDYGFAWIAVILAVLLAVVYITRRLARKRSGKKNPTAGALNKSLRRPHKILGFALILVGFIHGIASTQSVFSLNVGTVCWVLSILLGINWVMRDKLKSAGGWMFYHRVLTVLFMLSIVWHVVDVGGVRIFSMISGQGSYNVLTAGTEMTPSADVSDGAAISDGSASSEDSGVSGSSASATASGSEASTTVSGSSFQFDGVTLKDGTYTGSAQAYGPNLTVSVAVKGGKVASVEIVSHNERNSRYYATPMQVIPQEIVSEQTLSVDTVSGATFTSVGIINAVIDALQGAVTEGQLPSPESLPQNRKH